MLYCHAFPSGRVASIFTRSPHSFSEQKFQEERTDATTNSIRPHHVKQDIWLVIQQNCKLNLKLSTCSSIAFQRANMTKDNYVLVLEQEM
jgi:hypothetical protein